MIVATEWQAGKLRPPAISAAYAAALAEQLMPLLLEKLREMAPAEARSLAGAAADVPGLDALACKALADWLEERGMPDAGARVRKLPLRDGDLLVIQPPGPMTYEAMQNIREWVGMLERRMRDTGRQVVIAVVPHGFTLLHFRTGKREGT